MSIAYQELPLEAEELAQSDRPVYISNFRRDAPPGSVGFYAQELVRRGRWELRHCYSYLTPTNGAIFAYGRIGRKWWPAVEYPSQDDVPVEDKG